MMMPVQYEIETRVVFRDYEEAYSIMPFLKDRLTEEMQWITRLYGAELYKSDRLLRFSDVVCNNATRYYIGFKEKDIGSSCNIRAEMDEEVTEGLKDSRILQKLGIAPGNADNADSTINPRTTPLLFERCGHGLIVEFSGHSLKGEIGELGLSLKLMYSKDLKYPLLLELEKTANTIEKAFEREREIISIIGRYGLGDRMIRLEPTHMIKSL